MAKTKKVIQEHHLVFQKKIEGVEKIGPTVRLWKGEHWAITQLERRTKNISKGFIEALKYWISKNEGKAINI